MNKHKFPYKWSLTSSYPAKGIEYHGKKVFGTFVCGGGSTMGYKLAGYNHLGGVEIDPKIAEVYKANQKPLHFYLEDIRVFNQRKDLPKELYELDLLDGSPPCSTFSMAGSREKAWNKKKKFREGQSDQRLDDLVFEYVRTIDKLQPKVALLENVKGMIQGNAKAYSRKVIKDFTQAGYRVQLFLLNAASMGVPQKRERVFFIGLRNDFDLPKLKLEFNEPEIVFQEVWTGKLGRHRTEKSLDYWQRTKKGQNFSKAANGSWFNHFRLHDEKVIPTLTTTTAAKFHLPDNPECIDDGTIILASSFPLDYDYLSNKVSYITGMSVPPVMTAQIAHQIYEQWFSKIEPKTAE